MTEKLYHQNSYVKSFDAKIINKEKKGKLWEVELDRTYFYPTSGGQLYDTGLIDNKPVTEVKISGDRIIHILAENPENDYVKCEIDFNRRYDFMQQHTGQHLLTTILDKLYGFKTISSQLGEEHSTIDLDTSEITENIFRKTESKVFEYIRKNLTVKTYFVEKEELDKIPVRKVIDIEDVIRMVEIDGIDYSLCGGTHLKNTSEVNLIKIINSEKVRGNVRLYFLCGKRALEDYQNRWKILNDVKNLFSVSEEQLIKKLDIIISENKTLKKKIIKLNSKLTDYELSNIEREREEGALVKVKVFEGEDRLTAQKYAEKLTELKSAVGLIASENEGKVHLFFVRSKDVEINMNDIMRDFVKKVGGGGGGKPDFAQGGTDGIKNLDKLLINLREEIINKGKHGGK